MPDDFVQNIFICVPIYEFVYVLIKALALLEQPAFFVALVGVAISFATS